MESYAFQAQISRISPIGLVPAGLRIDVGFTGALTEGPASRSTVEGIDYLLIRHDGVGVIDAYELITGPDATATSVRAEGYVVPPFEMPPLEALLDPSFAWPDVDLPMHGSTRLQSSTAGLEEVNRTAYAFTGSVNMARGSLIVEARSIACLALSSSR